MAPTRPPRRTRRAPAPAAPHPLDAFFRPRAVALVGASARSDKLGYIIAENLLEATEARLHFVNPSYAEILGRPCYPSLAALPEVPDLAVIAVPASGAVKAVAAAGERGVPAALIISAGFAETGAGGARLQAELQRACRTYGIRAVGPNSSGFFNCATKLAPSIAFKSPPGVGDISVLTQSGASVMVMFEYGLDHGLRFAKVVDCGNEADVKDFEVLDYLGQDPETRIIGMFIEGTADLARLAATARRISPRKPIVMGKVSRTAAGARAAATHTASRPADARRFGAACRAAGILAVRGILDVAETAKALAWQPLPRGNRVAIVSASGGITVELADACAEQGLAVPLLSDKVQRAIRPLIPAFATARNPIDMGPVYPRFPEIYARCIEVLFASPEVDIVILTLGDRGAAHVEALDAVRDAVRRCQAEGGIRKPVYVCWFSGWGPLQNQRMLEEARIPCFEHAEKTARVAGTIFRYARWLRRAGRGKEST